jgi:hypothetical protein
MNATFRMLLALPLTLAACGRGQDLFLDQTRSALGCGQPGQPDCASSDDSARHHSDAYGDAGAPHAGTDDCRGDVDCGYGEVCERRHGVSHCEINAHHGHADGPDAGHEPCAAGLDAGTRCDDPGSCAEYDEHCGPAGGEDRGEDHSGEDHSGEDHSGEDYSSENHGEDRSGEDYSGSNSGRH